MSNTNRTEIDDLLRQRWHFSAHAVLIHANYIRYLLAKANFDPNQPRVPRGSRRAGRWVRVDGAQTASESIATPTLDRNWPDQAAHVDPPEPPDDWPDVPDQRPRNSRERTRIALQVANWMARNALRMTPVGRVIIAGHWLYEKLPIIESHLDAPRTLEELLERANTPLPGYDRHHIVERSTARMTGFSEGMINNPDNIVLIPRLRHWLINRWYGKPNDDFDGLSPREFLQGKSWEEQRRVGLNALIDAEVLKR